jgi:hypothetical protein
MPPVKTLLWFNQTSVMSAHLAFVGHFRCKTDGLLQLVNITALTIGLIDDWINE